MTNACLSSGRSEFKTCPNCHGDGYEDTPPMRKCGVCKGSGHVPDPATTKVERNPNEAEKPAERLCYQAQGGI
jgi:DnaJ-class molecular chaperone